MKAQDVACVVLASGLSSRFGEADKLQTPLCGKPVLEHVLETVSEVGFADVFVVVRDKVLPEVITVQNDNPKEGQGHALRLGLTATRDKGFEFVCVLLGDMPLVRADHIERLLALLTEAVSVISLSGEERLPPAAFGPAAVSEILAGKSREGARSIFDSLDVVAVPIAGVQSLDVDTPEDLARIAAIMKTEEK